MFLLIRAKLLCALLLALLTWSPAPLMALSGSANPCEGSVTQAGGGQTDSTVNPCPPTPSPTPTPTPTPTIVPCPDCPPPCCLGDESGQEHCNDGIDNDCDGFVDSVDSPNRPSGFDADPGCCPDDLMGCTVAIVVNEQCQHMLIPNCTSCLFPSDCEDLNPLTLNLCVSGRCVFHELP